MPRILWQKPSLQTPGESHRKVSWLELFYDLIFVVAVAQVAHHLAHHPGAAELGIFLLSFIPIWLIWNGSTYYQERFETESLDNRVFLFVKIVLVSLLSLFAGDPLGRDFPGFALAFLMARGFNIFLWIRAGFHHRNFLPSALQFTAGWIFAVFFAIAGLLRPEEERIFWWILALTSDVLGPVMSLWESRKLPDFSTSKLPERMGLFFIIVLGESLTSTVRSMQEILKSDPSVPWFTFLWTLPGAVGLGYLGWWLYFDFIGRRTRRRSNIWTWAWSYLHMPLFLTAAAWGALLDPVLGGDKEAGLWLMGSVSAFLVLLGLLETTLSQEPGEPAHPVVSPWLKFLAGGLLALLAWGVIPEAGTALGLSLVVLAVPAAYGVWVWHR